MITSSSHLNRSRVLLGGNSQPDISPLSRENPDRVVHSQLSGSWKEGASYIYPRGAFECAGLNQQDIQPKYFSLLLLSVFFSVSLWWFTGFVLFLLVPVFVLVIQRVSLASLAQKRLDAFDKDYSALLMSLSAGMKTGLDPLVALSRSSDLFPIGSVLRQELDKLNECLRAGETEERAIAQFAKSIQHPDVKLFRMAFRLARNEGSSLAICLQRLARVTRQRQSFRRKVSAAVAVQKLSAFGIAGCAILIGLIQATSSAKAFAEALAVPIGQVMIFGGGTMILVGLIWMVRMTKFRV
ncbi:MAG: type II secretion system F family protein [Bdellovibrionales bacterium]|nr:type II secretion system F family protein [Bdellovibrionales bacterium]